MSGPAVTWNTCTVAELAAPKPWALNGGPFGSKLVSSMYSLDGVPVIRGCNLPGNRRFNDDDFVFVTETKADELRQHAAKPGDLIFTQRGTLGQIGMIPSTSTYPRYIVSQSQMKLTVDPAKADARYLFYVFKLPDTIIRIHDMALRSGVPHINLTLLRSFVLTLPDVPAQHRIASILSAYDDLIEVNRRRVAVLEEMARRLFEEWFVHLRFPGHEGVEVQDTSGGPVPNGWRWSCLADVCADSNGIQTGPFGSQLHQADYTDEGVPVVMPKNITNERIVLKDIARVAEETANALGRHRMRIGDVVYGRRGDIGRRAYIGPQQEGWFCGTGCLRLRPNPDKTHPRYFFDALGMAATFDAIKSRAQGATMPNLSAGVLADVPMLLPEYSLQKRYGRSVGVLAIQATTLMEANARLAAARDLLLPRLLSGDLPVTAALTPEATLQAAAE